MTNKPRLVLINVDCEKSTNWAVQAQADDNRILQNEIKSRRKFYRIISIAFLLLKTLQYRTHLQNGAQLEAKLYCSSYRDQESRFLD